jgi:hypothetical protein
VPLVDSNQAALWTGGAGSLYVQYRADGTGPVGFERSVKDRILGDGGWMIDNLIAALVTKGLQVGQRIALIGCGFGWEAERFIELGYGPAADGTANGKVLAVDTSTWIQANKNGNAAVPILDADVNAATGRRTIRQQFGSNNAEVHWIISMDVLPILTGTGPTPGGNNEIVPFCQNLRSLASTGVAHWVSIGTASGDTRLNWKTLAEWKAWVTPDFVVQRGTATVL